MALDALIVPRFDHSTVVADIPPFGPVAFVLWGYGGGGFPLSEAQMIQIDTQKCKDVVELIYIRYILRRLYPL